METPDTPLIVSFYTDPPGTDYYSKHAKRFINQLNAMGCDNLLVEHREDVGSWVENTRQKPTFIKKCLEYAKRDVLWIDIDTDVLLPPVYAWKKHLDFACPKFIGNPSELFPPLIIRSTALWFNYTENAIKLIDDWIKACEVGNHGDHRELNNLLFRPRQPYKWGWMPHTYAHKKKSEKSATVMVMGLAREVQSRAQEMKRIQKEIRKGMKQ